MNDIPADKLELIKAEILEGRKIAAIKLCREVTGGELAEAKSMVERLEAEMKGSTPEKFKATPAGKGCVGMIACVAALVLVAAVCVWKFVF